MKKQHKKGIISLIVIFGVGLFALGAVLTLSSGAITELVKTRNIVLGNQSFHTAEAAAKEGALQFINASSTYTGGSPILLNGAGSANITVTNLAWPLVEVKGSADNLYSERNVIQTVTIFPEGLAFDYAVYAQNNLTFGGSLQVNGSVFANNGINFNGNKTEIDGNAYSPETIENSGNINGEIFEGVEPIPPPELDLTEYLDYAVASSTYFATTTDAEAHTNGNTILNEVIYITDDGSKASIGNNNTDVTGSIVKLGNMDLKGGVYTAFSNFVAIVVDGNLKISGGTTINGIVYVTGETTFGGGNNTVNGSLISAGGTSVTDLTGNATINFDPNIYANWQNLAGLNQTSTEEPRVINWREE